MANGTKNLRPPRSKEEAQERGRKGGIQSGASRRKKREAKEAIRVLLNLAAKGNLEKNLQTLGVEQEDQTNMMAVVARLFTKAMEGDVNAFRAMMEYGGFAPDQILKDEERKARIKAIAETGRVDAITSGDEGGEGGGVVIYLPELEQLPDEEAPAEEASGERPSE